jgi:CBS domain-containing protein
MDVSTAVTTTYPSLDAGARVSKLIGTFEEWPDRAVAVTDDDGFAGVVGQRQLLASRQEPEQRLRTLMRRDPPRLERSTDLREAARLMVESELSLLPVFEGEAFGGVVTARSLLEAVRPNLDALDVSDVYTRELVTVDGDATLGEVIHTLREHGISRVPVLEAADSGGTMWKSAVGMVSVDDIVAFVLRETDQEQGGAASGFDGGGDAAADPVRTHGGFGERAGFQARLLDLPARDVMSTPVADVSPETSLGVATERMLDRECSSLIVDNDGPVGIVTLTDVVRSLTWTESDRLPIQIFGIDLLTGTTREEVAEMVEDIDGKYADMDVIEAYVVLHRHEERQRDTPLVQATIRLFTDKGRFAGTGEEYGAAAALRDARDRLERNVLDEKEYEGPEQGLRNDPEAVQKLLGWWIDG